MIPHYLVLLIAMLCVACETGQESGPPGADSGEPGTCELVDYWPDLDDDGWGAEVEPIAACEPLAGQSDRTGDCDDDDPTINPGADELCNGVDDNCDGVADDGQLVTWYQDADADGWGDPEVTVQDCEAPTGWVADGGDCDDGDPEVNPGAVEECDLDDDDCDGRADQGEVSVWYSDEDGDGWGHPAEYESTCTPAEGWVQRGGDCDPADPDEHPEAPESCDLDDDDCDGEIDEGFDQDGDGYISDECAYIDADQADCDDDDDDVHPLATEVCEDGIDQDCSGDDVVCGFDGEYLLNGAGAALYSPNPSYDAGRLVDVGDVDGDGREDLVVATLYAGSAGGGGYLVYGAPIGSTDLGSAGYFISGTTATMGAGRSIGLGDTDGDGLEDIIFGAPYSGSNSAWVIVGPVTSDVNLEDVAVQLAGEPSTYCGHGTDLADVNADGFADAVVGAYYTNNGAGTAYVSYGPVTADVDLINDADAVLEGPSSQYFTGRVMRAGQDFDGDGIGDILAPAPYASVTTRCNGTVFVVYGPVSGTWSLSAADGELVGEGAESYAGSAIGMGDVNGDGLSDALVGAYGNTVSAVGEGAAYVVYGPASGTWDLASADVVVRGDYRGHSMGAGVAAGHVNIDGNAELLVGASDYGAIGSGTGSAYLFYGPLSGTYASTDAEAWAVGEAAGDLAGQGVAIGDLDGDGWGELIVGAPGQTTGGTLAGAAYVLFPGT